MNLNSELKLVDVVEPIRTDQLNICASTVIWLISKQCRDVAQNSGILKHEQKFKFEGPVVLYESG